MMISDRKYQNHIAGRNQVFAEGKTIKKEEEEAFTVFDRLTKYCSVFTFLFSKNRRIVFFSFHFEICFTVRKTKFDFDYVVRKVQRHLTRSLTIN